MHARTHADKKAEGKESKKDKDPERKEKKEKKEERGDKPSKKDKGEKVGVRRCLTERALHAAGQQSCLSCGSARSHRQEQGSCLPRLCTKPRRMHLCSSPRSSHPAALPSRVHHSTSARAQGEKKAKEAPAGQRAVPPSKPPPKAPSRGPPKPSNDYLDGEAGLECARGAPAGGAPCCGLPCVNLEGHLREGGEGRASCKSALPLPPAHHVPAAAAAGTWRHAHSLRDMGALRHSP